MSPRLKCHNYNTMIEVNFYLRNKSLDRTAINAFVSFDGKRLKLPTEIRIETKHWNIPKQRVKEKMEIQNFAELNNNLDRMEALFKSIYNDHRAAGVLLTPLEMKNEFHKSQAAPVNKKIINSFWDFYDKFISVKSKQFSDVRDYDKSLRKHLKNVEELMEKQLSFLELKNQDGEFIDTWNQYLKFEAVNAKGENGLSPNTIGKQNKNLKVFLNWCFDNGITSVFSIKHFPTIMEDVDNIYLKESEIDTLLNLELEDSFEQKIRDLFIIGCETGLRYSDFTKLSNENLRGGLLTISPQKTSKSSNNKIIIPLSERFKTVLSNNNGSIPKIEKLTITIFNKTIRAICLKAKIDESYSLQREIGGKSTYEVRNRYEDVSSHTCRRTFCTLKFLKGMPAQAIMKFSGHKTERNFLKYLKLDAELTANKYEEFF